MGLNRPVLVQLGDWLWGIVRGDLGTTLAHGKKSVAEMIRSRVIPSISLALLTEAFAVIFGIPLGVIAAWKANTWIDRTVMVFSTLGFSIPLFWLGFIFMIIFAVQLGVLPATGYVPPSENLVEFLRHMIMPVAATGLVVMSLITRMTRATVRETLAKDYIRTARAKGLVETTVLIRHALRNAILPILTVTRRGFALLLGGVVVTEQVFAIPGMGRLMVGAISSRDFPLIQGTIVVVGFVYAIINLFVDITYAYLDPRIKY